MLMAAEYVPSVGAAFPLLLNFREVLLGNGFVVEVDAVNGRALCVKESDGFWIYGVNPGGMSAFGHDARTARKEFRAAFSDIMRDIASECDSFGDFEQAVRLFFADTNPGYEHPWADAVAAVRAGAVSVDGLEKSSADASLEVRVGIKPVGEVRPADNQPRLNIGLAA